MRAYARGMVRLTFSVKADIVVVFHGMELREQKKKKKKKIEKKKRKKKQQPRTGKGELKREKGDENALDMCHERLTNQTEIIKKKKNRKASATEHHI